jgi:hypothetical protein
VTSCIVVCCILLAAHEKLGVKQLSVVASADLVDWARIEINEDRARDIFAASSLVEEGLERAGLGDILGLWVRTSIGLKAMLKKIARERLENKLSVKI